MQFKGNEINKVIKVYTMVNEKPVLRLTEIVATERTENDEIEWRVYDNHTTPELIKEIEEAAERYILEEATEISRYTYEAKPGTRYVVTYRKED